MQKDLLNNLAVSTASRRQKGVLILCPNVEAFQSEKLPANGALAHIICLDLNLKRIFYKYNPHSPANVCPLIPKPFCFLAPALEFIFICLTKIANRSRKPCGRFNYVKNQIFLKSKMSR